MSKVPAAFSGDLGLISPFDLVQLLRLNGATGCLMVRDDERNGALYFDGGQLVNAVDDRYVEGEDAAFRLFAWRRGSFTFRPEPAPALRTIDAGTEAVMMEAARRIDEDDGDPASGETHRLREHRTAMEALRDVVRRVAGEAREQVSGFDPTAATAHLHDLTEPEDRLLYRPGKPPYTRRLGYWVRMPEGEVSRADYITLCTRLLDACDPVTEGIVGPMHRRMTLGDGRMLSIVRLDPGGTEDSLWLRLLGPAALDPATLEGDVEALEDLVARREGLLILGAPDVTSSRRLLEAVSRLAMEPGDTLVLVCRETAVLAPHVESGMTLCTTPGDLREVIETVQPEIVAVDPGVPPMDLRLDDLAAVPRILVAVVGTIPAAYAASWRMRVHRNEPDGARVWLRAMLCGVVSARVNEEDDAVLEISVRSRRARGDGARGGRNEGIRKAS